MKKLSVIIPCYNDASGLERSVREFSSQTRLPDELIIVNDGSTDDSAETAQNLASQIKWIKVITNHDNIGVAASINKGSEASTGDYVYHSSCNDCVEPTFFEKSLAILEGYPQAAFCCTDSQFIQSGTGTRSETRNFWLPEPGFLTPLEFAECLRMEGLHNQSVIARRDIVVGNNTFHTELKWHSDFFHWHVWGMRQGICYVPEPLVTFELNPNSYGLKGRKDEKQQLEVVGRIIKLLKSEYKDILGLFAMSGALNHIARDVVKWAALNSAEWDIDLVMLLNGPNYLCWEVDLQNRAKQIETYNEKLTQTSIQLIKKAGELAAKGHIDASETTLREFLRVFPNTGPILATLVDLYMATGRFDEAITQANRLVAVEPELQDNWQRLIKASNACNNLAEETKAWEQMSIRWPEEPEIWKGLGSAHQRNGNEKGSSLAFNRIKGIQPTL